MVEAAIRLRIQGPRIEKDAERVQIFGLAGEKRQTEALAEPSREANVIGMTMRRQDPRQRSVAQRPFEERLPDFARDRIVDPRVDQREAVAILDEVDVDVVEAKRKRQSKPQYSRRRLDPLEGFRSEGKGKFDRRAFHSSSRGCADPPTGATGRSLDVNANAPARKPLRRQPAENEGAASARRVVGQSLAFATSVQKKSARGSRLAQILDRHCRNQAENKIEPSIQSAGPQADKTPDFESCALQFPNQFLRSYEQRWVMGAAREEPNDIFSDRDH